MNEKKWKQIKWNEILYRLIYAMLLLCMVLFAAGRLCGVEKPGFWHVFMGLLTVCVLVVLNYSGLRGRLFCGIGICAVVAVIVVFMTPQQAGEFAGHYYNWFIGGNTWLSEQQQLYEIVQSMLLALLCYGVQALLERLQKLRYIIAALLLAALLVSMFLKQQMSHMGTVFVLWYVLLSYVEWTKVRWKKERSRDEKSYMLWILPFCVVYLLLLSLSPTFPKPYDWKLFRDTYANVKESVTALVENITNGNTEDFEINFAGFSEDGELKGSVVDAQQQMMTVQGVRNLKTNVYLTGKVYDTFDGQSWTTQIAEYPNERMLDSLEMLYAIKQYEGNRDDFVAETRLTIRYRFFQSGYLFAPMKTTAISCDEDYMQNTDIRFKKKQGYGTSYELSFLQMNLDQPSLYEYMEQSIPEDQKTWNMLATRYMSDKAQRPSWKELLTHREMVYRNYVGDVQLSDETEAMLDRMTEGQTTTIGRLQAIERELSSYSYTKTPGEMPSSVQSEADFMDYFLDKRAGYCSYFATAFVLLARAEGVPARYVEGFSIPTQADQEVVVCSGNAHAWPEVYIDGFGWIPFEPTPGYADIRYTPWNINGTAYQDTAGKPYGYGSGAPTEELQAEETGAEEMHDQQRTYRLVRIIGITLSAVLLFLVLFFVTERLIRLYRYRHMSTEERFVAETRRNLWLLSRINIERESYETLQELKNRGEGTLPEIQLDFLNDFEAYIYGNETITEDMLQKTIARQQNILEHLKNRKKWHYYWIRLIM